MKNKNGFTLIEVIVYLSLFAIVVGGSIAATYQMIEGSKENYRRISLEEEGRFILKKFDWALTGASSVFTSQTALSLTKDIEGIPTHLIFAFDGQSLTLQRELQQPLQLNSNLFALTEVSFAKTEETNGAAGIAISFTLSDVEERRILSRTFSLVKNIP